MDVHAATSRLTATRPVGRISGAEGSERVLDPGAQPLVTGDADGDCLLWPAGSAVDAALANVIIARGRSRASRLDSPLRNRLSHRRSSTW